MRPRPAWGTDDDRADAEAFNQTQIDRGSLTVVQLTELVADWQCHRAELDDDGKFGPATRGSVQDCIAWPDLDTDPATPSGRSVGLFALRAAVTQIGLGEVGRNNAGENVIRWGGREGAPWCATFVSWALTQGALAAGQAFELRSAHAKTLFARVRKHGQFIGRDPRLALPGDIVAWHRGKGKKRLLTRGPGHIGIVERWDGEMLRTLEGNIGGFYSSKGARVRRFQRDIEREGRDFIGIARY